MADTDADTDNAAWLGQEANTDFNDPLLECLVIVTQLKQSPFSADALRAGLPLVNHRLTPPLFIRAAERAGLNSRLLKRKLNKISSLVLPVVLLLKDGQACVVTKLLKNGQAEVIFPEVSGGSSRLKVSELQEQYTGYVFFIQREHEFEPRAEEGTGLEKPQSWFWGTLWLFRKYYFQVILASFFINIFAIAMPLFIMNVYDRVVPNQALETLWVLATGVTIVFIFDFIMRMLRGFFIDFAGKKVDVILASRLFQQALGITMMSKPKSTGVHANHLREFENVREFFTSATVATLADLPFIALFIWVVWMIAGYIAIIPTIAVPLVIISAIVISMPLHSAVQKSFTGGAQKHAILVESLNNLDVIKSVCAEGMMLGRWEKYVSLAAESGQRSRFLSMLAVNTTLFIHHAVMIGVVVGGVYLVEANELTVGGLIAATILSGRAMGPLGQITSLLTRYQMTKLSLKTLNNLMELPVERPVKHKFLHRNKFQGEIEFDDISFGYPGQETELFKGISFHIKPGERVGILGSMGAGKTTMQKLIMGFYPPSLGSIRIDGTDLAQIDPADLRRHVGYVGQDPRLFFGTVRDNIAMKAPWVDDSAILNAARISGADSFISKHSAGYDMEIGEGGEGLSGGQCQAITIARAMISSPSILLLDEPTSCMDNSSEKIFVENVKKFAADATLLLVTHKVSILPLVDRLIVLQAGRIVADGPKERVLDALKQLSQDREVS